MKRIITATLFLMLFFSARLSATHLLGGEITWVCLPNGQFQFTMKIYRDCNSSQNITINNGIEVHNYPTVGSPTYSIPVSLFSQTDISPQCNAIGPAITCGSPGGSGAAVEEFIYKTQPVTLSGTPPAEGWIFSYDGCCRNGGITNLVNPGNDGFTLRAKMFAFNGSSTGQCYDSSPSFAEKPALVTCAGVATAYSHNANDIERDSLAYSWASALGDYFGLWTDLNPPTLNYSAGYSATSPLPGTTQNPSNQPAVLNPSTGAVTFLSNTAGIFVTVIKVEAWKCGVKVAEIFREIPITILAGCGVNNAPTIQPLGGVFTNYTATVAAGDLVSFTLAATDAEMLPNGNPQSVIITASGNQFGTGFSNPNAGCDNPPCATLSPVSPVSGINGASTNFSWQTDCNHLSSQSLCASTGDVYTFVFDVSDDFCPLPAKRTAIVTITVTGDPVVNAPLINCATVLTDGDAQLTWTAPQDTGNTFNSYHIYHSTSASGPFTVIDSIFDLNTTTYVHIGAAAHTGAQYYYIRTRAGCEGRIMSVPSNTVATIFPEIPNPGDVLTSINWNPLSVPLPPTSVGYYTIEWMQPGQPWTTLDSVQLFTYLDTVTVCSDSIFYRVIIEDTTGCVSVSAVVQSDALSQVSAGFNVVITDPLTYSFQNTTVNALHYLWDLGDGTTSVDTNVVHTFAGALDDTIDFNITLIAFNACDTDTFIYTITYTDIIELTGSGDKLLLYPNPAGNHLTVNTESGIKNAELRIYNALGQLVTLSVPDSYRDEGPQSTIDISSLSPGIYYLHLQSEHGLATKKFVKK